MTGEPIHETYMQRCLDLAREGLGQTAPNPLVGSVIVFNNRIIGEGYHKIYGGHHAEVNAVNSVEDKSLLRQSTLYVNLEPCSHTGKTPPCADLIILYGIPEVVIGTTDPNPLVAGEGIRKLLNAGVKVTTGILEKKCFRLNRRFFTWHRKKRPFIILKWAQTRDGFIDVIRDNPGIPQPTWISNEISRMLVHKWRSEEQAILIGKRTAALDNPRLNVREWNGRSPVRMVIDSDLSLSHDLHIFDNTSSTVIFNSIKDHTDDQTRYVLIDKRDLLKNILDWLYHHEIQSILIEGGRMLLQSMISDNLWDEARVFEGTKEFGNGIQAPDMPEDCSPQTFCIREDLLRIYSSNSELVSPEKIVN